MVKTNLFFHRGPIREPEYFFGRTQELAQLFNLLMRGQSVSISGQRRLGKTSLLFFAMNPETSLKYGLDTAQTSWAYIDGGMLDGLPEESVYGAIYRTLKNTGSEAIQYEDLLHHLQTLGVKKQRLIIVFDEFEIFTENERFQPRMFNRLRGLATQLPVQFLIASKDPLAKLTFSNPEVISSSFFNIFAPFQLSLFQEQEAISMLASLSERSGQAFQADTIDFLLELVGPHPHFLQVAGYHTFELQSQGVLSAKGYAAVKERTLKELEGHLEYYWRNLSDEEQYILATLPQIDFDSYSPALAHLFDYGLLYKDNYLGLLLKQFVGHQSVPGLLCHGAFVMDERRRLITVDGKLVHLTPTEFAALRLLLQNPGHLLTPENIEANLWPDEIAPDPERARGIMKKLRSTLGEAGEALVTQRGQGYRLV
jgi:hypothetical protein